LALVLALVVQAAVLLTQVALAMKVDILQLKVMQAVLVLKHLVQAVALVQLVLLARPSRALASSVVQVRHHLLLAHP
jgi:hypothetical protein